MTPPSPTPSRARLPFTGGAATVALTITLLPFSACTSNAPSDVASNASSSERASVERAASSTTSLRPLAAAVHTPGVISTDPWTFGSTDGHTIRTEHYRVFTTESSPILRERITDFLERALAHYRTAAVDDAPLPAPPLRLDTYLMDNRAQWRTLTKRLLRDKADNALAIGRGGYATRGIGAYYDIGLYDTLAVAAHEGWHQYTQRTFRQPLPTWLEEGMATFMEGHRWSNGAVDLSPWANVERFDTLRHLHADGRLVTLAELINTSPMELVSGEQVTLLGYYAQCWALVHFLESGDDGRYRPGLVRLLRDAAEGDLGRKLRTLGVPTIRANRAILSRRGPALLRAYVLLPVDMTMDDLEARYGDFVEQLVAVGSRDRIVQGQPPAFLTRSR